MGFEELLGVNPWTALFVLLNTLAIYFVAKKFLFAPVMKMIHSRQQEIDDMYAQADTAKKQAQAMENEYAEKLADASRTGERIVREAVARGQSREEEILQKAKAEADAIREKAADDAALEKKKAMSEAKSALSDIAVDIAEKIVERNLDARDQTELTDQFIARLGDQT